MKKLFRSGAWFYLPALLLVAFFVAYPFFNAVCISFVRWNGYSASRTFIGLGNYLTMLGDRVFRSTFFNTLVYGFGSTALDVS